MIAQLVDSLKRQDYPAEYLDVYVVADNCVHPGDVVGGQKVVGVKDKVAVVVMVAPLLSDMGDRCGGWPFHSLSEDTEFTVHCILEGEKIGYCGEAELYDEQPTQLGQSIRQRMRWVRGNMMVLLRHHEDGEGQGIEDLFPGRGADFLPLGNGGDGSCHEQQQIGDQKAHRGVLFCARGTSQFGLPYCRPLQATSVSILAWLPVAPTV